MTPNSNGRSAPGSSQDRTQSINTDNISHVLAVPSSDFKTRLEIFSTKIPNFYIAPFCGASAGVASGIVTCPLDVIKTKLQAQGGFRRGTKEVASAQLYRGMLGSGRRIWRDDGIRGLYQGLGPMLLGYLPTWAVYLAVYDRTREYFYDQTGWYYPNRGIEYTSVLTQSQEAGGYPAAMLRLQPVHVQQL
jgi:solute carrier family 25 folate transporter 32